MASAGFDSEEIALLVYGKNCYRATVGDTVSLQVSLSEATLVTGCVVCSEVGLFKVLLNKDRHGATLIG